MLAWQDAYHAPHVCSCVRHVQVDEAHYHFATAPGVKVDAQSFLESLQSSDFNLEGGWPTQQLIGLYETGLRVMHARAEWFLSVGPPIPPFPPGHPLVRCELPASASGWLVWVRTWVSIHTSPTVDVMRD